MHGTLHNIDIRNTLMCHSVFLADALTSSSLVYTTVVRTYCSDVQSLSTVTESELWVDLYTLFTL